MIQTKKGRKKGSERMKYRKKPVVVEAVQYFEENLEEIKEFVGDALIVDVLEVHKPYQEPFEITVVKIRTLEGVMCVDVGDYVIKGVRGEFYPCKPDIFEETYERVDK